MYDSQMKNFRRTSQNSPSPADIFRCFSIFKEKIELRFSFDSVGQGLGTDRRPLISYSRRMANLQERRYAYWNNPKVTRKPAIRFAVKLRNFRPLIQTHIILENPWAFKLTINVCQAMLSITRSGELL
jgi:hypothetical protein